MVNTAQSNEVGKRSLGLIEATAMTGTIQPPERFPGVQLPASPSLWAGASRWVRGALNDRSPRKLVGE